MSKYIGYAETKWHAEDIQSLRPEWTLARCNEWLADNQKGVTDRLVEVGQEAIESLLPLSYTPTDSDILCVIESILETNIMVDWDHNDAGKEFLRLANYITRMKKGESCDDLA